MLKNVNIFEEPSPHIHRQLGFFSWCWKDFSCLHSTWRPFQIYFLIFSPPFYELTSSTSFCTDNVFSYISGRLTNEHCEIGCTWACFFQFYFWTLEARWVSMYYPQTSCCFSVPSIAWFAHLCTTHVQYRSSLFHVSSDKHSKYIWNYNAQSNPRSYTDIIDLQTQSSIWECVSNIIDLILFDPTPANHNMLVRDILTIYVIHGYILFCSSMTPRNVSVLDIGVNYRTSRTPH